MRYRQRYVDLIMNPEVKDTFIKRSKVHQQPSVTIWMDQGFHGSGDSDVSIRMPAELRQDHSRLISMHWMRIVKLRISLELYLKRLIVGGMEKCIRDRPCIP